MLFLLCVVLLSDFGVHDVCVRQGLLGMWVELLIVRYVHALFYMIIGFNFHSFSSLDVSWGSFSDPPDSFLWSHSLVIFFIASYFIKHIKCLLHLMYCIIPVPVAFVGFFLSFVYIDICIILFSNELIVFFRIWSVGIHWSLDLRCFLL